MEKLLEKAKVDLGNKKPEDVYSRLPQMKERGELAKATDENDTAFIMLKRWLSSVEWLKKTKWYRERRKQFDTYASSDQVIIYCAVWNKFSVCEIFSCEKFCL